MSRRAQILTLVAAVIVAAATGFYLGRGEPAPLDVAGPEPVAVGEGGPEVDVPEPDPSRMAALAPPETRPYSAVPLPPAFADGPLAEQIDELERLAAEGHPEAACRLAIASLRCQWHQRSSRFASMVERSIAQRGDRPGDDRMISAIAGSENATLSSGEFCDGIAADRLPGTGDPLQAALGNLSVRQKVVLAMLRPDGGLRRLQESMAPPAGLLAGGDTDFVFPQFLSDHALGFLDAGIAAVDPLALEGMILVHSPIAMPWELMDMRITLPDARRFLAYAILHQRLYGPYLSMPRLDERITRAANAMPDAEMQRILAFVDAEEARWRRVGRQRAVEFSAAEQVDTASNACE
jgi:hypothetical protein